VDWVANEDVTGPKDYYWLREDLGSLIGVGFGDYEFWK